MTDNRERPATPQARDRQGLSQGHGRQAPLEPIFIVGQYKCGTTWLLHALSAHPDVAGVREIDIVRGACDFDGSTARLAPVAERLRRFFDDSGWCAYLAEGEWLYRDVVARFERGERHSAVPANDWRPQKFMHLAPDVAKSLYDRIKNAQLPEDVLSAFLDAVCANRTGKSHVVLKACDQIAVFDALQSWQPKAKKIVITRDGRDAAISCLHYTKFSNKIGAPFRAESTKTYWDMLRSWAHRADMIVSRAQHGEIWLVRYEDLTRDFGGTLAPLLKWLGLDHSERLVKEIDSKTCFEAQTGRKRGTDGEGLTRKGAVGEWMDVLGMEERAQAWEIAHKQLCALGYTEDGVVDDFQVRGNSTAN